MHAVKRRNRTHEIHNLHKTHRPRSLQNALSVAPAQAGARPEAQLQLFEHFGESQHAQTTEAQRLLLPAHLQGPSEKSFRRPTCHAYDYAALIVPTAVCICIGMHAVKRRNRTHEIHNLHKTHRPRSLQNALSVAPAQAGARPEAQLQLFEHFGESQHDWPQARLLPAMRSRLKSFRRPTCHAYDYAALIVPTAVCICIGMHAVKRRNRTHEIHNLHKTHRPRSLQNALSVAPAQAEPGLKHSFSCLSILAKANMLKNSCASGRLLPAQEARKRHLQKIWPSVRVSDGLRAMRTITLR